jgi:murein DD-endopeptidase MepM/ murein hydrolase activator NlpD
MIVGVNRTGPLALAGLALGAALVPGPPVAGEALEVGVRARAVAPGEPLRVVVTSRVPLVSLVGRFAGHEISFARLPSSPAAGERWEGWAMVGLDEPPGPRTVDVVGRDRGDGPWSGSLALAVEAKPFPEERLEVEPRYVEPPAELAERLERERLLLDAVWARRSPGAPHAGPFLRPVGGEPTSVFGTRRLFNGEPRAPHPGLDLRAATGTPVRSSGPGEAALARELYWSGGTVIVDHGGGLFTVYAHLSEIRVEEGGRVEAGQWVGLSGASGRVTGPHLHWGAKIGDRPFDPTALLDPALFR